jgi:distribution and morphology protein 10
MEADIKVLPSRFVPFRSMVDRFQVHPAPRRPIAKEEIWLAGRRVEGRGQHVVLSR